MCISSSDRRTIEWKPPELRAAKAASERATGSRLPAAAAAALEAVWPGAAGERVGEFGSLGGGQWIPEPEARSSALLQPDPSSARHITHKSATFQDHQHPLVASSSLLNFRQLLVVVLCCLCSSSAAFPLPLSISLYPPPWLPSSSFSIRSPPPFHRALPSPLHLSRS